MGGEQPLSGYQSTKKVLFFLLLAFFLLIFFGLNAVVSSVENTAGVIHLFHEIREECKDNHLAALSGRQDQANELALIAKRVGNVRLNESALQPGGLSASNLLEFTVFDDYSYTVMVESVAWESVTTLLNGKVAGSDYGYLNISAHENVAAAILRLPATNKKYILTYNHELAGYYLYEVLLDQLELLRSATQSAPPVQEELDPYSTKRFDLLDEPETTAIVDLLALYTPAAASWAGSVENLINLAHNDAIVTLNNSELNIDLRKVHAQQVNYLESGDLALDLNRLTFTDGEHAAYLDEAHALRELYGADLVVLFIQEPNYEYSGMAWGLSDNHLPGGAPHLGFAVVNIRSYANYSYIHELGHLFGAGHHRDQEEEPGPQLFAYSAGWSWQGDDGKDYCSVMSYLDLPGGYHEGVAHFSNPDILHMGQATGVADHADNARTIRETMHIIAAYRDKAVTVTTPVTPSGIKNGMVNSSYTYTTGGASCLECSNLEYRFDWGDGHYSSWGSSMMASYTWSEAGTYQVRAQARCTVHTEQQSAWSGSLNVTMIEPVEAIPVGDLQIGARVVDNTWQWQFRTGEDYTYQEDDQTKPVVWLVVARDHYGADSGVTLLSKELIGRHTFDNSTSRWDFDGSNHWGESGIFNANRGLRPWLNSTGIHEGEGFYAAFSESFKSGIITTTLPNREWVHGNHYTTRDKVFIPSTTELGDSLHHFTYETGNVYPYYSGMQKEHRIAQLKDIDRPYWTRSTNSSVSFYLNEVLIDGRFHF